MPGTVFLMNVNNNKKISVYSRVLEVYFSSIFFFFIHLESLGIIFKYIATPFLNSIYVVKYQNSLYDVEIIVSNIFI